MCVAFRKILIEADSLLSVFCGNEVFAQKTSVVLLVDSLRHFACEPASLRFKSALPPIQIQYVFFLRCKCDQWTTVRYTRIISLQLATESILAILLIAATVWHFGIVRRMVQHERPSWSKSKRQSFTSKE